MIDVKNLPVAEDTEEIGPGIFWELDEEHLLGVLGENTYQVIHCYYNGYRMEYTQRMSGSLSEVQKWMSK